MERGGRNANRLAETTGIVISAHPVWRPGAGARRKFVRLRIEYDTPDGPAVGRFEVPDQPGLRVGSAVPVRVRRSGVPELRLPDAGGLPWWRPPQLVSGLLAYVALVVLVLLVSGGIYYVVVFNAKPPVIPAPSEGPSDSPSPPPSPAEPPSPSPSPS